MESSINLVTARMQEIEARIASLRPQAQAPISAPNPTPNTQHPIPFSNLLAKVGGNLQIRPLGTGAGPFSPEVEAAVAKYAAQNNLDPEMVRALIQQESGGNPNVTSAAGAQGLMQLMPQTSAGFGVQDPFNPDQNIAAGTRYLAGLLREFNGDIDKTLAAYNAGPAAVRKAGGVPPFPETQNYVRRIKQMMGR